MKNSLIDVLFFIPIPLVLALAIALHLTNKSEDLEPSTSSITSTYNQPIHSVNSTFNSPKAASYQSYAMAEPFAAHVPFENTPAAWMQMMNNIMNTMQMTQMMHQMAAMPIQMMNLAWMNPYVLSPSYNSSLVQQTPMDPAEYKKWYEKQFEGKNMDKKQP